MFRLSVSDCGRQVSIHTFILLKAFRDKQMFIRRYTLIGIQYFVKRAIIFTIIQPSLKNQASWVTKQ